MDEQHALSRKVEKRLKTAKKSFKNKSNKIQFGLNTDVLDKISEAKIQLDEEGEGANVKKAMEELNEGMEILEKRNRGIEMAEYSEFGWATVDEYEQREIAVDSDDDRRLRKAEASVARKFQSKRRGSFRGRYIPTRNTASNASYEYQTAFNNAQRNNQPFRGGRGRFSFPRANSAGYDKCFACGARDHWRDACPFAAGAMAVQNDNANRA